MRADVNLSIREVGSTTFGTRTEMKNLNSFKAIARAIEGEKKRQIELLEDGKKVIQETRRWDDNKEYSYAMRSKEDAQDYRYFPEPDLVPIRISDAYIEALRARQPELRDAKKARYISDFGLPEYDADILTGEKALADLFENTVAICKKPKEVSNWLMGETMRLLKETEKDAADIIFTPEHLAGLIALVDEGTINRPTAKTVFEEIFAHNVDPAEYVREHGLAMVSDTGALEKTIREILEKNPQSVADFKAGKTKAMGFLVGQTMRAMKGQADPAAVNSILSELLQKM
jgi:aspartyl-tRNA(Asn)/glutamyl-tRNA(Gln) amidotransferase subunit B